MIAITTGTTSYRQVGRIEDLLPGEIAFDGTFPVDPVWDEALQTVREKTADEVTAEATTRIKAELTAAVQAHMDGHAQTHGYDNVFTAVSYLNSTVDLWQRQAVAFRDWRDAVWVHCYQVEQAVAGGQRSAPTADELIAELPAANIPLA